ncbi:uncharacterized protein DUF1223 [Limnobacter thiooxidans]|uniref:DUF1223 domain-containing protein n=1 Tax=Limnobacter thiooxidans TaxID=131080 RepID=A0AA86M8N1_9BURK|nr:uncharacterized protein DUF1223 [Limnobacter thiooxidans]BET26279.1 DUF1223 domain-containing protein [Limnobacter thiooxidans]
MENRWKVNAKQSGLMLAVGVVLNPTGALANTCNWTSTPERMIVAELYTSEGCSSCPPADRWLSSQLTTPERARSILALSFHVDYWNYIGWQDPYSSKQFTQRQYAHKSRGNVSQIYTPQYVFSNREVRRWGQAGLIPQQLAAMKQDKAPISLHMSLERKQANQVEIKVKADWLDERYKAGRMFIALYEDKLSQQVKAGENRGELLRHDRVVRHLSQAVAVSSADSVRVFTQTIPADWNQENVGIGVIVENSESNTVLQALNATGALARCS